MESDAHLLHEYLETRSEAAFAALVHRHLPLVYGAALRRVGGDVHRAQDVAQMVFATLARKAPSLRGHPVLTGWLYTATNHCSAKTMRTERRRMKREEVAAGIGAGTDIPWDQIRPVIDDVLLDLPERDRTAILLRFFQNETFSAIGARLGLTDSGARMRTEHALESLRASLAKRGITSTGAAIGGALMAHGAVVAPAGVAAAIAANAAASAAAGTGLFILMSTSTLKTGAVVAVLAAGAAGLFMQNGTNHQLRSEVESLRADLAVARRDDANLRKAAAAAKAAAAETNGSPGDSIRLAVTPANAALAAWALRVENLKLRMVGQPEQNIPEQRFLSEDDWLDASKRNLETEEDYRTAMADIRNYAEAVFGSKKLQPALKRYAAANGNQFPTELSQLQAFFDEPIEAAILDRWAVLPASTVSNLRVGGDFMVSQKAPVDLAYDKRRVIGASGTATGNWPSATQSTAQSAMLAMLSAYRAANNGQEPSGPSQLVPFAATPEQQAMLQQLSAQGGTSGSGGGAGAVRQ